MLGGGFLMVPWWLVPIAIAVAIATCLSRRSGRKPKGDDALEILRQRYACGEIGTVQFQEAKRNLGECCHGRAHGGRPRSRSLWAKLSALRQSLHLPVPFASAPRAQSGHRHGIRLASRNSGVTLHARSLT